MRSDGCSRHGVDIVGRQRAQVADASLVEHGLAVAGLGALADALHDAFQLEARRMLPHRDREALRKRFSWHHLSALTHRMA